MLTVKMPMIPPATNCTRPAILSAFSVAESHSLAAWSIKISSGWDCVERGGNTWIAVGTVSFSGVESATLSRLPLLTLPLFFLLPINLCLGHAQEPLGEAVEPLGVGAPVVGLGRDHGAFTHKVIVPQPTVRLI